MGSSFLKAASATLILLGAVACARIRHSDTICAIPRDASQSFYVTQHAGMAEAASRLGVKVYWNGPRGGDDTQQQIELMDRAIQQRNAGIVITPTAAFALDTVIQRALSNKIPVVVLGATIPFPPDPNLSFVVNDIDQSGHLAACSICSKTRRPGEIAIIGIDPITPGNTALVTAFEKYLRKCGPTIRIVSKVGSTFTSGPSKETITRLLAEHPALSGIYSLNTTGTRGAVSALRGLHRGAAICIVSADPNLDLMLLLRRGTIDALIFPNMREMGERAVENIIASRRHALFPSVYILPPVLVTRENLDTEAVRTLVKVDWRQVP